MQHSTLPSSLSNACETAAAAASPSGHSGRLLIVDDDRRMASQAAQWLCRQGFHASAVATATEALAALGRERFDACLLDVALPDAGSRRVAEAMPLLESPPALIELVAASSAAAAPNRSGSGAILPWPATDDALLAAVSAARAQRPEPAAGRVPIVGSHASIRRCSTSSPVLATRRPPS
jgi:Response regulator containing CheY-like receiver, AAA-type ATPase, and DNA-binding domains